MRAGHLDQIQGISRSGVPKVDFHMHTTWTDGSNSAREMHERAVACGLKTILFSEHSRKTSGDWFPKFAAEVRALPCDACRSLVGVETKVEDFEGNLDCSAAILGEADLVMASVHRFPGEKGAVRGFGDVARDEAVELEFKLANKVLENPEVDILGHPFGMCYRRFQVRPPEHLVRQLIAKAASTGVAFEINTHYHPDPWQLIQWCKGAGAKMSLGSNAHTLEEVGRVVRILEGKEPEWIPSGF